MEEQPRNGRIGGQEPRFASMMQQKGMTMQILRGRTALIVVLFTAILSLGACQMTALGPQDSELFQDYLQ